MTYKALNRVKGVLDNYLHHIDYEAFRDGAPDMVYCAKFLKERLSVKDYKDILDIKIFAEDAIFCIIRLELNSDKSNMKQMITGCLIWNGIKPGTSASKITIL